MEKHSSCLFTSEQLATHIVDTLVDHGFVDEARFKDAVASIRWELDAQHGMGRITLNAEVGEPREATDCGSDLET